MDYKFLYTIIRLNRQGKSDAARKYIVDYYNVSDKNASYVCTLLLNPNSTNFTITRSLKYWIRHLIEFESRKGATSNLKVLLDSIEPSRVDFEHIYAGVVVFGNVHTITQAMLHFLGTRTGRDSEHRITLAFYIQALELSPEAFSRVLLATSVLKGMLACYILYARRIDYDALLVLKRMYNVDEEISLVDRLIRYYGIGSGKKKTIAKLNSLRWR